MPLLTLDSVSLAFGHLPLFENASLQIDAGERIALIGRNGSGKSSLLKVVAGDTPPDAGSVWRAPGLRVSRLDQDVPLTGTRSVHDEVAAGLSDVRQQMDEHEHWRLEHKVSLVLSRLALPAARPVGELSGGWRRRALLGKALVSEPDLLLLDEPTNHLDIDAIRWLEEYLATFPGALLFVTHDRAFLSRLATRIVELDRGSLVSWPGSYETYLQKKADALENEARDLARLDKKLAQEEAWLRQGVKARRTRNEGRVKALMELRATRADYRAQSGPVTLSIDAGDASGKMVFEAKHVSKSLGGVPIVRDFSQRILRGDRIGLIGPNGSGKTTLLRLLVGELEPDNGTVRHGARLQVAYYDQQREQLDPEATVVDSVNDGNTTVTVNGQPRHIMGYLADFLFPRERAISPVKSLSGGERNRLLLARLFARPANVLVLDEPTNDLDIETLELLEELIGGFDGTVLLVSHDRAFLDDIVTSTLSFEGAGKILEYVGGYEDYRRQSSAAAAAGARFPVSATREKAERTEKDVAAPAPGKRKLGYNEVRELEGLPPRIEALEVELAGLRERSHAAHFYKAGAEEIRRVLERIEEAGKELETTIARWMELEDRA